MELLVVISIVALLISLLLPALNAARRAARQTVCGSNQRQIGTAIFSYASDFDGYMPPKTTARGTVQWTGTAENPNGLGPLYLHTERVTGLWDPTWESGWAGQASEAFAGQGYDPPEQWLDSTGSGNGPMASYLYRPKPVRGGENAVRLGAFGPGTVIVSCWASSQWASFGGDVRCHELTGFNYLYRDGHVNWIGEDARAFWAYPHPSGDDSASYNKNADDLFFTRADL